MDGLRALHALAGDVAAAGGVDGGDVRGYRVRHEARHRGADAPGRLLRRGAHPGGQRSEGNEALTLDAGVLAPPGTAAALDLNTSSRSCASRARSTSWAQCWTRSLRCEGAAGYPPLRTSANESDRVLQAVAQRGVRRKDASEKQINERAARSRPPASTTARRRRSATPSARRSRRTLQPSPASPTWHWAGRGAFAHTGSRGRAREVGRDVLPHVLFPAGWPCEFFSRSARAATAWRAS